MKGVSEIGCILLAAGASTRLGSPKQLLELNGKTLLENSIETVRQSDCKTFVVVLGAHASAIRENVDLTNLEVVENPAWKEGMGASLQVGLRRLFTLCPAMKGVLVTLCDQPYMTANLLNQFVRKSIQNPSSVIASRYDQSSWGVPALFPSHYFSELLCIQGQSGAKKIIKKHFSSVSFINFPQGKIDIDTREAYERVRSGNV